MLTDDLKASEFEKIWAAIRDLQTPANMQATSLTKGRFRVGGTAILLVDSEGGVVIEGRLTGDGTITWSGVANYEGEVNLEGVTTIIGVLNQMGPWNLAGDGGITGDVIQTGTITLRAGGEIIIEGVNEMTIGITSGGQPGIQFASGGSVAGTSDGAQVRNPALNGFVGSGAGASFVVFSSNSVQVTSAGTEINGPLTTDSVVKSPFPTIAAAGHAPNLWQDPTTKQIYRTI